MTVSKDLGAELCPDGVEFRPLGELGTFFGGLTGKTKKDFGTGSAKYIPYGNIFANGRTDLAATEPVSVGSHERQNQVHEGDVLFTGSSENLADVGMSSVVTAAPGEPLYLNSFSIGFRWGDGGLLLPRFAAHLFRSSGLRRQIVGTANGVTRFNVSKAALGRVLVPVPPVPTQHAVVDILDTMQCLEAELEAELKAELVARSRQFAHYRDDLLTVAGGDDVSWRPMGDVGEFIRGRRFTKADFVERGIPAIHYGEIYTQYGTFASQARTHVRSEMSGSLRFAQSGDVVIAAVGETVDDVGKAVAWLGNGDVAIHDDCFAFRHEMNPKFVAYYFQTERFHDDLARHVARAKVKRISGRGLAQVLIPVLPLTRQEDVVAVLDAFDELVNDFSSGLRAEMSARRKQYEHYRDLLLTFPEKTS